MSLYRAKELRKFGLMDNELRHNYHWKPKIKASAGNSMQQVSVIQETLASPRRTRFASPRVHAVNVSPQKSKAKETDGRTRNIIIARPNHKSSGEHTIHTKTRSGQESLIHIEDVMITGETLIVDDQAEETS